ncbi:MAG: NAD-dependent epimerase/dehydratase family protein [Bacteroidetes bacterium]|nr:NAD-dependent epimerase/dehydratase family protein [Bacteroidota bacterium]
MTPPPHTVLVTGASGFVGTHLVRFLSQKGHTVRALYNSRPPAADMQSLPGVTWLQCDLLDVFAVDEVMQGVSDVYHCAAIVSFKPGDKERLLHFNVESTANVANAALEHNVRKLVYISSIASLGRKTNGREITEEEQWEESGNNSVYARSKYLAELEVWRAMGEGLDAVIVNPGIILGEGDWSDGSARLMKIAYNEFPFYTSGINGWVDVADVVRAMYELMQSDVVDERFIITEGNHAYKDIFTMMATALDRKPPHIHANRWMTNLVWRWNMLKHRLTGGELTITRETANTSQNKNFYSNSKLLQFLPGFRYTPMPQTIQRMAQAYLQQQLLKK